MVSYEVLHDFYQEKGNTTNTAISQSVCESTLMSMERYLRYNQPQNRPQISAAMTSMKLPVAMCTAA